MPIARVNGADLHYEVHGSGPNLVFIHGENHGIEMFAHQVDHFSAQFQCLTYYRRGHGRSGAAPYGYSCWNQNIDLLGLLDALALDKVVLVAVAMSTPIAVTFTVRNQGRVSGLVLASWYELDGYPQLEERRQATTSFPELSLKMEETRRQGGQAALEEFMERASQSEFPILPDDPAQRAMLIRMFSQHPEGRYLHAAEFCTSLPYLIPELLRVECPVLGICGDLDPSPDKPERLEGMPNFRQTWIKDARRFPTVEQPDAFNQVLAEFLGDRRSAT